MDTRASTAPDSRPAALLRVATELTAWTAAPWALARHSVVLAVLADVLLIGLPALLSTPGDKKSTLVPVPGPVTIVLVLLQLDAAVAGAWFAWPRPAAVAVTVLAAACLVLEQPRWRWLATARPGRRHGGGEVRDRAAGGALGEGPR
ncbi:hypothetical protein [Streptacidiphilus sp. ASG 303]|uniref:hypothetical protein n=1 Tax=Streptomycetaceae TaxID=2062 RepID=UPI001E46E527|nr:hypothetical protein [Streptacidiphilus sp. ASG 303]MCD0482642.1 hypothetical protein [Streptacidiphilus sp. ASG 303]